MAKKIQRIEKLDELIHLIRGQKIMLDSDLAKMYGVTTKRLKEQFKRNRERFPKDFAFVLTRQEVANLRSQIATSSLHGGLRYLPIAFTEHGVIMLASILNSPVAIEASVRVVRAFINLREMLLANKELAKKFSELEKRLDSHDEVLGNLFEAIRQLLTPSSSTAPVEQKPEIGFHIREEAVPYRIKKRI